MRVLQFLIEGPVLLLENIDIDIHFFKGESRLETLEDIPALIDVINHSLDLIDGVLSDLSLELIYQCLLVSFTLGGLV